jgi:hypothetical protein
LEVSRLELLLQVGTFCSALGALLAGYAFKRLTIQFALALGIGLNFFFLIISGIFGMNLKSYLETSAV